MLTSKIEESTHKRTIERTKGRAQRKHSLRKACTNTHIERTKGKAQRKHSLRKAWTNTHIERTKQAAKQSTARGKQVQISDSDWHVKQTKKRTREETNPCNLGLVIKEEANTSLWTSHDNTKWSTGIRCCARKKSLQTITHVQVCNFYRPVVWVFLRSQSPSIRSTLFRMAIQRGPRREAFPACTAFVIFLFRWELIWSDSEWN